MTRNANPCQTPFVTYTYWHRYECGAAVLVEYNNRCEDCPTGGAMIVWQLGYWGQS